MIALLGKRLPSILIAAAALGATGCAHVGKYGVRLEAPEVRKVQERFQSSRPGPLLLDTDAAHTLSSDTSRIVAARFQGGELTPLPPPGSWEGVIGRANGGVDLIFVERKPGRPNRRLAAAGGYTALAGAGLGLVGLVVGAGAVLVAGPANDTHRVGIGGAITMAVGAGVALVGGTVALVGMAPAIERGTPISAEDLGRGRLR